MHIPDGFLTGPVLGVTAAASAAALAAGLREAGAGLGERQVPVMGAVAAFVFGAQMVNFPILFGTSGHVLGSLLCALVLGPWPAFIVMTTVLIIQALLFGDGGYLALGANVLNMAVIATFGGYFAYRFLKRFLPGPVSVFGAGWFSVVAAALACAVELGISGCVPMGLAVSAMGFWHALIGVGEGLITALVIGYLARVRPDVIYDLGEQPVGEESSL